MAIDKVEMMIEGENAFRKSFGTEQSKAKGVYIDSAEKLQQWGRTYRYLSLFQRRTLNAER